MSEEGINIVDIATSAMRAAKDAMETMYSVSLTEVPTITKEPVIIPKVMGTDTEYIAMITLEQASSHSTGFVLIFVSKEVAKELMEKSGLEDLTAEDISDSCGELCNLLAGTFKMELNKLGHTKIEISTPKLFANGVNEQIEKVDVQMKYIMKAEKDGKNLVEVHLAFESMHPDQSLLK